MYVGKVWVADVGYHYLKETVNQFILAKPVNIFQRKSSSIQNNKNTAD